MGSLVRHLPASPLRFVAGAVVPRARRSLLSITATTVLALLLAAPCAASTAAPSEASSSPSTPETIQDLIDSSRYAEAESGARALLSREERLHGPNSLEAADALDLLGDAMRRAGKGGDPEVRAALERAVRIKEALLGPENPATARSLTLLGLLLYERSQYGEAGRLLRRGLEIRERALGPDDPIVARSLQYVATLEYQEGRDSTALSLIERAIDIERAALPADDPRLGESMNVLASILYYDGDFARAGPLYEQVLTIYLKAPRRNVLGVATCHNNLGAVYSELGEYELSRRHLEESLALRRGRLGARHPLVASTLVSLGTTLESGGDLVGARARYEEGIRILRRAYGEEHSDYAWALMRLGRLEATVGRYPRARALLEEALGIQERVLGKSFPDLCWSVSGLAAVQEAEHQPEAARRSYERALEILERAYGAVHPDRVRILNDYAAFLVRSGDSTQALDRALRSATARAEQLRFVTRGLAERQALTYLSFGTAGLDLAVELAAHGVGGDSGVRDAWDALIRSRTLVLDEMAWRQNLTARAAADSSLAATVHDVDAARRRYAGLLVRGARDEDPHRFRAKLDRAQEAAERAERDLAASSVRYRAEEARARIGWRDVLNAIPPDAALAAFALCDTGRAASYVVFVARPGESPRVLPLGPAREIDALVDRWVREIVSAPTRDRGAAARRAEARCRNAGEALRARIWDPLLAALDRASRVFVVPDGSLYRVNFSALPAGASGYLVDSGPLVHLLTSERDLVPAGSRHLEGTGLLALGGASFGEMTGRAGTTGAKVARGISAGRTRAAGARGPLPDCPEFRTVRFEPLPGAAREVDEIARLWPDSTSAVVLIGARASESELRRLVPGRLVLHLATHGFFLDATHCTVAAGRRGIGGISVGSAREPSPAAVAGIPRGSTGNPLRLSGLALAGANRREEADSGDEDGILTAEEVASLDLSAVEWAVLSACDTGVGRVQTGEGVLGLRRAFRIAGAHTVIMSLWAVDDLATLRWMKALYQARFRQGLETAEAIREADRNVLREQRAQSRSTHPFFWAGFVASGDWR